MLRRLIILSTLIMLVIPVSSALAQPPTSTPTPSPTFHFDPPTSTHTPTPTATLDLAATGGLVPIGAILAFGDYIAPDGWLLCDGHAVYRSEYPYLFQQIGTIYGVGDGSTTFNVPDFRGRTIVGSGAGLGLTNREVGVMFGNEQHTLTITEIPPHTHTVGRGNPSGSNPSFTAALVQSFVSSQQTSSTGGGAAFNISQPSLAEPYYIFAGVIPTSPNIEVTVILVFPSHTPTSTATPTLTPTSGPSPTPTATATATPIAEIGYQVGDQTIVIRNDVRPGDLVIAGLLSVMIGLLLTMLFLLIRRRS